MRQSPAAIRRCLTLLVVAALGSAAPAMAVCTYALAHPRSSMPPSARGDQVDVITDAGCTWSASSNDPEWLTITSPATPLIGSGIAYFAVTTNLGGPRTGTLTIAGQAFLVEQGSSLPFVPVATFTGPPIPESNGFGSGSWGDFDGDGDLDLLLTGTPPGQLGASQRTALFRNDGGVFTGIPTAIEDVGWGNTAWGDYDNDGDLDVVIAGHLTTSDEMNGAIVYRNDGAGVFTSRGLVQHCPSSCQVAWSDYDNDGDLDVILTANDSPPGMTTVYRNDHGVFQASVTLAVGVRHGTLGLGDYDNDGDLDILIAGDNRTPTLLRNDGAGVFTAVPHSFQGAVSSAAWGDYDNDGDLDVVLIDGGGSGFTEVYRNDGGAFTVVASLPRRIIATASWADYDDDGDLDIALTGSFVPSEDGWGRPAGTLIYRNDGGDRFSDSATALAPATGWVAWGDYDNDRDLDVIVTEDYPEFTHETLLYRNDAARSNTAPGAPSGLGSSVGGRRVALSWSAATDEQTPSPGLSYNLRVGTSPGAGNIVSPMAAGNGGRRIAAIGNAQVRRTATLTSLAPGTYYWSVQAIDTSLVGGPFSAERTFVVTASGCAYSITPQKASTDSFGGAGTVEITASGGCAWVAVSNDPWISFTTAPSGVGTGRLGYSIAPNSGGARRGSFMLSGRTFNVEQAAAAPADLSIVKDDLADSVLPGQSTTYSITVSNEGPSNVKGATVSDVLPAAVTSASWTCTSAGGARCGRATGSGNIAETVDVPALGSVSFVVATTISPTATGPLTNTAAVSLAVGYIDTNPANNAATDTDSILLPADISVSKTDGVTMASPGQAISYAIVVSNDGPNPVSSVSVHDDAPEALVTPIWACVPAGGAACGAVSGSGAIAETVSLPVGGSVMYTMSGTVEATPATLSNTASAAIAQPGYGDPDLTNNTATDRDLLLCAASQGALVPDGRPERVTLEPGASRLLALTSRLGASYSLEAVPLADDAAAPTVALFSGDDGCTGVSTASFRDTASIDPATGSGVRLSFTAAGTDPTYRVQLTNGGASAATYGVSLVETTAYSAAWSNRGSYETYYSVQNTTDATVNIVLEWRSMDGVMMQSGWAIPPHATASMNTSSFGFPGGDAGVAQLTHDGPPGAVVIGAAIANFGMSRPYVQPVKFEAVRERR